MKYAPILFLLSLTGCQTIAGWADGIGQHMPVIGERCDHWQCITDEGQESSEMNQRMRQRQEQMEKQKQQQPPQPAQPAYPASGPEPAGYYPY